MVIALLMVETGPASDGSDEALYRRLSAIAIGKGDRSLFERLNNHSRNLAWGRGDFDLSLQTAFTRR